MFYITGFTLLLDVYLMKHWTLVNVVGDRFLLYCSKKDKTLDKHFGKSVNKSSLPPT